MGLSMWHWGFLRLQKRPKFCSISEWNECGSWCIKRRKEHFIYHISQPEWKSGYGCPDHLAEPPAFLILIETISSCLGHVKIFREDIWGRWGGDCESWKIWTKVDQHCYFFHSRPLHGANISQIFSFTNTTKLHNIQLVPNTSASLLRFLFAP